jgi:hypothetical protein
MRMEVCRYIKIRGKITEAAWRGLCAAYPPLPRGATAAWRPDRLQCRSRRWCYPGRRLCAHSGTPVLVPDTWPLRPPAEDQNASDRRLPLVWRRWIHAATDTLVRRPLGRLPGDRLARLGRLARRRQAEEAPGRTAPKLRGAHAQ